MSIATLNSKRTRKAGVFTSFAATAALLAGMLPGFGAGVQAQANCRDFKETGHKVCGRFLEYWNQNGGLAQQGFPLTDVMKEKSPTDGKTYDTQYFERAVFEMHPENQPPNDVLLSLLGVFQYKQNYSNGAPSQTVSTAPNAQKFTETGFTVGGKFLDYWKSHGGLAQQGYPISNEFQEKSALNGKTYTVQYFQRAVFESHPENQPPFDVLLSQLGKFQLEHNKSMMAGEKPDYPGAKADLTGAGATFPEPIINGKWIPTYTGMYSGVKINYQGIGSGGGKKQITAKTVDFAGSDSPLTDAEFAAVGGPDNFMHIPWVMGGIVLVYNLPGVTTQLKFDGPTVANIYLGNITKWNDPAIASLNPGVNLPNNAIAVVHRSEGSGTTDNFTDYLNKVSDEWKSKVGRGASVQWPVGVGAQGNPGVTQLVKQTSYAIGYVEVSFAKSNNVAYALMKNKAGNFVDATAANVSEAADGVLKANAVPADLRYTITDSPGANAYPIAATSWLLTYVDQPDVNKGKALAYFAWWAVHDGQAFSEALGYAPLPKSIQERSEAQIKRMKCGSGPCFP